MFKNKLRTLRGHLLEAHSQLEIDSASDLQHCSISWLQFSTRTSSWVLSQETPRNRARCSTIVPRFWEGDTNRSITLEHQLALWPPNCNLQTFRWFHWLSDSRSGFYTQTQNSFVWTNLSCWDSKIYQHNLSLSQFKFAYTVHVS